MKFKDSAGIFHDIGMKFKDGSGVWHDVGAKFKDNEGIWRDVYPPVAEELILLGAPGTAANWTLSGGHYGSSGNDPRFIKTDTLLKSSNGNGGGPSGGSTYSQARSNTLDFNGWNKIKFTGKLSASAVGTPSIRREIIIRRGSSTLLTKSFSTDISVIDYEIMPISNPGSGIYIEIYVSGGSNSSNGGGYASFEITSVKLTK